MELNEDQEGSEEGSDDEGLVAPKGLDQQADAQEASRKTEKETSDQESE